MNENLNLVEILKDCPKGIKLYLTTLGEVEFCQIDSGILPIRIKHKEVGDVCLTQEGKAYKTFGGECILFPSKEQRDWSKFKLPYEFKDGDIIATDSGTWIGITMGGRAHCFIPTYCVLRGNSEVKLYFDIKERWEFERLATEEEKQKLFRAIKNSGYKWKAETKTFERLVKPKFDTKTLKPFDKVLVRFFESDCWRCEFFFSHITNIHDNVYRYTTTSGNTLYDRCIPYNEDTKHLVGITEEAPEYYRYWED